MNRKSIYGTMCLFVMSVGAYADDAPSPVPVSPGATSGFTSVEDRCPTFSWGGIPAAQSYELVAYSVTTNERPGETGTSRLVLTQKLPARVDSWTPPLERCLTADRAYAWSIRAVTSQGEGTWSDAHLFRIVAGPSVSEVEEALAVLRRFVAQGGEITDRLTEETVATPPLDVKETAEPKADTATRSEGEHSQTHFPREKILSRIQSRGRHEPLSSNTVGFERLSAGTTVAPSGSYALVANGDTALEGAVFREGFPFLHNYGGVQALNTALGLNALAKVTPDSPSTNSGEANTALGHGALFTNDSGDSNTAVGAFALFHSASGRGNSAFGLTALANNTTGSYNVGIGAEALASNRTGSYNVAVGRRALSNSAVGSSNIALGNYAGYFNVGWQNIFIGNYGSAGDVQTIRIGHPNIHEQTSIAGKVGLGTNTPLTRLHVVDSISGTATPSNHVAFIENTFDSTNADVLGLKIGAYTPSTANNFVTFFLQDEAIAGQIEGNPPFGVIYSSTSGDYAEWLRKRDPGTLFQPGEVVGLFGDSVSRTTTAADGVMVVSTAPIVAGNDPGRENRDAYVRVAFVGQVKTRVHGVVRSGDYLVPSGMNDGRAVAVRSAELDHDALKWVIGRALADRQLGDVDSVLTLVGVADPGPLAAVLTRQNRTMEAQYRELQKQADELARQQLELARHKADLDDLQRSIFTIPIMEASQR